LSVAVRVSLWPFGSFATTVSVYVLFFFGVNASGMGSDWFARIGATGCAVARNLEPSRTVYVMPIDVPTAL
jgi:hypothetical protein